MRVIGSFAAVVLLAACGGNSVPDEQQQPDALKSGPEVVTANEAVEKAEVAKADPGTMSLAEIEKVLDPGPGCSFSYTEGTEPILVARVADGDGASVRGVIKLHGKLVELRATSSHDSPKSGITLHGGGITTVVTPVAGAGVEGDDGAQRTQADMRFMLDQGLSVGYRGFYTCSG